MSGWELDPGQKKDALLGYSYPAAVTSGASLGAYAWLDLVGDPEVDAFVDEWLSGEKWNEYLGNPTAFASAFQSALTSLSWWAEKDANWRAGEETRLTDPGTWAENVANESTSIRTIANTLGITLSDDVVNNISINSNYNLWTETELEQAIIQQANTTGPPSIGAGSIQNLSNQIMAIADQNFVSVPEEWAIEMAMAVKSEQKTSDQVIDSLFNLVVDEYDFYGEEKFGTMRQGDLTIADSIKPAIDAMSETLEVDVSFADDIIKNNLVQEKADGTQSFINKNQAVRIAMQDDRYKQTSGYKNKMKNVGNVFSNVLGVYSV